MRRCGRALTLDVRNVELGVWVAVLGTVEPYSAVVTAKYASKVLKIERLEYRQQFDTGTFFNTRTTVVP